MYQWLSWLAVADVLDGGGSSRWVAQPPMLSTGCRLPLASSPATRWDQTMHNESAPLITHATLAANGLTANEIRAKVQAGELTRVRRGVYDAVTELGVLEEHRRLVCATVSAVHETNVISHVSAAVIHDLPVQAHLLGRVWMTRRSSGHGRSTRLVTVRNTAIDGDEVMRFNGMTVTTPGRTVADLARTQPYEWGVITCDAALRSGVSSDDVRASLVRHTQLRGVTRATAALAFADSRSESPAESLSRVSMARAGIPPPVLQWELFDHNGEFVARPDFAWPDARLVGEVDGKWKYGELLRPGQSPQDAIMAEKRREERIRQQGFWVVRWDWESAANPARLGALLRRALSWRS